MSNQRSLCTFIARGSLRARALATALVFATTMLVTQPAHTQTYTVLHNFTGGQDGGNPYAGLTPDRAGNLYGSTPVGGGGDGIGSVFKMTHGGDGWTLAPIYNDGGSAVTIGPNGLPYAIGTVNSLAVVFSLQPPPHFPPNILAPWTETTLYSMSTSAPYSGVVFDQAGNIYGTTQYGGTYGEGTVYELSPSAGGWTETVLYNFGNGTDGQIPCASLVLDAAGNLYGTTLKGGAYSEGTVFELSYSAGSGWTESFLYSFTGLSDGGDPYGGLIFDSSGNLYGTTSGVYAEDAVSTVFKLTPSGGTWTFSVLYSIEGGELCGPHGTLAMDAAGNLYDTTHCLGAHGDGSVFKLTPTNGGWTYTSLYDFQNNGDGTFPYAGVTVDANGNVYGTTEESGADGYGVVFEITP